MVLCIDLSVVGRYCVSSEHANTRVAHRCGPFPACPAAAAVPQTLVEDDFSDSGSSMDSDDSSEAEEVKCSPMLVPFRCVRAAAFGRLPLLLCWLFITQHFMVSSFVFGDQIPDREGESLQSKVSDGALEHRVPHHSTSLRRPSLHTAAPP